MSRRIVVERGACVLDGHAVEFLGFVDACDDVAFAGRVGVARRREDDGDGGIVRPCGIGAGEGAARGPQEQVEGV